MTDQSITERALRQLWTSRGVPVDRQDEIIAEIKRTAESGAVLRVFEQREARR